MLDVEKDWLRLVVEAANTAELMCVVKAGADSAGVEKVRALLRKSRDKALNSRNSYARRQARQEHRVNRFGDALELLSVIEEEAP